MTPEAKKKRERFEVFLKAKLPVDGDTAKYSRALDSKIKKFYTEKLGRACSSIYEVSDENAIYKIIQDIASNPSMVYRTGRRGDPRMEGLNWYIEFLNAPPKTDPHVSRTIIRRVRLATPKMEGRHIKKEHTVIQRNPGARKQCIEHFGCKCAACGIVMSEKYGEIGDGFIEVHHLNPIHLFDDAHEVNYLTDLIPLCPNCHAMIHKFADPGDLEGLKRLIEENRK